VLFSPEASLKNLHGWTCPSLKGVDQWPESATTPVEGVDKAAAFKAFMFA